MAVVGEVKKFVATFRDENGDLADPDTTTARITAPSGTTTLSPAPSSAFVNESVGRYVLRLRFSEAGRHDVMIHGESADLAGGVNACASKSVLVEEC